MKHEKLIQDSASAYTIAYKQGMEDTHNPRMAAQIASVVVMSYMATFKETINQGQEQQAQAMLGNIVLSMMGKAKKESKGSDEQTADEKKAKDDRTGSN